MPNSPARRLRAILLPLALLIAACGRVSGQPAAGEAAVDPGVEESTVPLAEFSVGDSEMLSAPTIRPWGGGDPTWSLSREDSDLLILAYAGSFIAGSDEDPTTQGYPRMPEACYDFQPSDEGGYPAQDCLYPVLRQLGVTEDAIRYYIETGGTMVLGLAGDGPVQVADVWWGPYGPNDHPEALILTPEGFMSSSPNEWTAYTAAEKDASEQDVLRRIIAATGEGGPYYFNHVYPWSIYAPARTSSGWEVATIAHVIGGCHGCDVEFGGRFVLGFDGDGTPTGARFDGFCWYDYFATDNPNADRDAILALREELPPCAPARSSETIIQWENPSQWQG